MNEQQGHIKHWNHEKGYGFIARDGADDVFVHISQLADGIRPRPGLEVRFTLQQDDKGRWQASQVELPEGQAVLGSDDHTTTGAAVGHRSPLQRLWGLALVFAALILAAGILWKSTEPFYTGLQAPSASVEQSESRSEHLPAEDSTAADSEPEDPDLPLTSHDQPPAETENTSDGGLVANDEAECNNPIALQLAANSPHAGNAQLQHTLQLINQGGPYPYRQDNTTFQNREGLLPQQPKGYYREYTVDTPGVSNRGTRRVVTGGNPPEVWYYTNDHYASFEPLDMQPASGPLPPGSPYAGNPQLQYTLSLILQGGPYPYVQDNGIFHNRERLLPQKESGYYRQYTVESPDTPDCNRRRVVTGGNPPEIWYYTEDHYRSFSTLDVQP